MILRLIDYGVAIGAAWLWYEGLETAVIVMLFLIVTRIYSKV